MRKFLREPISNLGAFLATVALILTMLFTGTGAGELAPLAIGGAGVTNLDSLALSGTLAVTGASTLSGAVTLPTGDVSAGEIADVVRAVNLPLFSWIDCTTNAGAAIGFDTTADALVDFEVSDTDGLGFQIQWDDTSGSLDTSYICNTVNVPADYVSGGAVVMVLGKDAQTTNAEFINCQGSIDGAALGTVGTTAILTSTIGSYTCTPTLTSLAAGDSLGLTLQVTATTALDDIVSLYSVEFTYTATQ
ncbi:MAG: hypothetical protein IT318_23725 [Anaerolineales bacterium]|nr:hypothetical protein [Anaerolineales bacterium]